MKRPIAYSEARAQAEEYAKRSLEEFTPVALQSYLSERHLESEGCWMFFKNELIVIPPQASLRMMAYVVSKHGELRLIADFSDDPERLANKLKLMSDFFVAREGRSSGGE